MSFFLSSGLLSIGLSLSSNVEISTLPTRDRISVFGASTCVDCSDNVLLRSAIKNMIPEYGIIFYFSMQKLAFFGKFFSPCYIGCIRLNIHRRDLLFECSICYLRL